TRGPPQPRPARAASPPPPARARPARGTAAPRSNRSRRDSGRARGPPRRGAAAGRPAGGSGRRSRAPRAGGRGRRETAAWWRAAWGRGRRASGRPGPNRPFPVRSQPLPVMSPRFLAAGVLAAVSLTAGCRSTVPVEIERIEASPSTSQTGDPSAPPATDIFEARVEAQAFLDSYASQLQPLYYASALAQWAANTRIADGDDTNARRVQEADEALAAFTGSVENIERARHFLEQRDALTPLQVMQLEAILYAAAAAPQTVADLVSERIAAETAQSERLYG